MLPGIAYFFKPLLRIIIFSVVLFCGTISTVVCYIILQSGRIKYKIIKNAGPIGTTVVGVVTGLDAAFNLADRAKKSGWSSGSGESNPDKDDKDDKDKDSDKKKRRK